MIVKYITSKSSGTTAKTKIKNLVQYIANPADQDENEKCCCTYMINSYGSIENFLAECYAVCALAKKGQKAFDHYVLSWPEYETPSEKEAEAIVRFWTHAINPDGLAFSGLHVNTEDLHLHFAIQRYSPDGNDLHSRTGQRFLYTLHTLLYIVEKRFGFSHQANPLVLPYQDSQSVWKYVINPSPRSVQTFRPKRPDLLPVVPYVGDLPLPRKGSFYYFPNEDQPCIYAADGNLVLLQWYRKELVDIVSHMSRPVYNIAKSKVEIPLSDIPVPVPPARTKKNIRADFRKAMSETVRTCNQSLREEQVVRHLFDLGYDEHEIFLCLQKFSRLEKDRFWNLRVRRILQSARRSVNRFRQMVMKTVAQKMQWKEKILKQKALHQKFQATAARKTVATPDVSPHM